MAYVKNNWATGDIITAEKLNHMESGIEEAATLELPVVSSSDNGKVLKVDSGEWKAEEISELPVVSSSDNGKVLKVDSGEWKAEEISELPAVSASDNGKILKVYGGAWEAEDTRFVVTCTPTGADLSGTVDKTAAEIYAAYQAGLEIIVRLIMGSNEYNEIRPIVHVDNESELATLAGIAIDGDDQTGYFLVQFYTSTSGNNYGTTLFTLTPYSPTP